MNKNIKEPEYYKFKQPANYQMCGVNRNIIIPLNNIKSEHLYKAGDKNKLTIRTLTKSLILQDLEVLFNIKYDEIEFDIYSCRQTSTTSKDDNIVIENVFQNCKLISVSLHTKIEYNEYSEVIIVFDVGSIGEFKVKKFDYNNK